MSRPPLLASALLAEGQTKEVAKHGGNSADPTLFGDLVETLIVVRLGGQILAYRNSCPHQRVPLNWRPDGFWNVERTALLCSLHGALFDPASGECLRGPCVGRFLDRVSVVETDGYLWLSED